MPRAEKELLIFGENSICGELGQKTNSSASLYRSLVSPIPMKTILTILVTLMISQFLFLEYGPRNPAARVASATASSVRWFLHSALDMLK